MSSDTIPNTEQEFEAYIKTVIPGAESSPEELTDEAAAEQILGNESILIPGISLATFSAPKELKITRAGSLVPAFAGQTRDQWSGSSPGYLRHIGRPEQVTFIVRNGVVIRRVRRLVIFFFNARKHRVGVFIGKVIPEDPPFTVGHGNFTGL